MKKSNDILQQSPLFANIETKDFDVLLQSLDAKKKSYKKGEYLFKIGEKTEYFGVLLLGRLIIEREDFWGNNNIISEISPGEVFAESFASVPDLPMNVNVLSASDSEVLIIPIKKIMSTNTSSPFLHSQLMKNLLKVSSKKNIMLNEKLSHITNRTTKQKIMSYLSAQSQKCGSSEFFISFNRQQLADYLSVERSAMSYELCKLRDEGILSFNKNHFILKNTNRID